MITTNSEGRRIAKTDEQIAAFWRWFGDSKVVDDEGRPLVMYHGTMSRSGFRVFKGGYFTSDVTRANAYTEDFDPMQYGTFENFPAGVVYPVYLRISKPTRKDEGGAGNLKDIPAGSDGVIGAGRGNRGIVAVVAGPAQIKSAIGNRGTFDPKDPVLSNPMLANPHPNEAILSLAQGRFFLALERQIAADGRLTFEYDVGPAKKWGFVKNDIYIGQNGTTLAKIELIPTGVHNVADKGRVYLGYIGVFPYVRKQGVGKLLMEMIANAADEARVDMDLNISPDYKRGKGRAKDMLSERQLQRFYEKYGFVSEEGKHAWRMMKRRINPPRRIVVTLRRGNRTKRVRL